MSQPVSSSPARRNPKKIALYLLLLLIVAAAGWATYTWWKNAHTPPKYVTAEVTQGDIERSVNVTGSINPRVTVQVGSYVSGTVKSLSCDFNTEVKAGQICAKIDPSTFQVAVDQNAAQVKSTQAQLRKDQAAAAYAKSVLDRDTKLMSDGIVAQEVLENDRNVYKQAQAQIEADKAAIVAQEASLKSAMVSLGYTNIVSPVDGTVLTRNVDVGQTVASSLQTPTLFLIGKDMTKMQVDANVSEADVGRIQVGQEVTFSVQAYPDKEFSGKVRQIRKGPITVQNVVTYDVVVAVDNPDLLLFPGMTADAEIVTDSRENVMRVPLAATRFSPEAHARGGKRGETGKGSDASEPETAGAHDKHQRDDESAEATAASAAVTSAAASVPVRPVEDAAAKAGKPVDATAASASDAGAHRHQWSGNPGEHREHGNWNRAERSAGEQGGEPRWQHRGDNGGEHPHGNRGDWRRPATAVADASPSSAPAESAASSSKAAPRKRSRVWVMRDGQPTAVRIVTGLDDGEMIEVLGGDLKVGDKVIVNEVKPVETRAAAPAQSPFAPQGGGRRGMGR